MNTKSLIICIIVAIIVGVVIGVISRFFFEINGGVAAAISGAIVAIVGSMSGKEKKNGEK